MHSPHLSITINFNPLQQCLVQNSFKYLSSSLKSHSPSESDKLGESESLGMIHYEESFLFICGLVKLENVLLPKYNSKMAIG